MPLCRHWVDVLLFLPTICVHVRLQMSSAWSIFHSLCRFLGFLLFFMQPSNLFPIAGLFISITLHNGAGQGGVTAGVPCINPLDITPYIFLIIFLLARMKCLYWCLSLVLEERVHISKKKDECSNSFRKKQNVHQERRHLPKPTQRRAQVENTNYHFPNPASSPIKNPFTAHPTRQLTQRA